MKNLKPLLLTNLLLIALAGIGLADQMQVGDYTLAKDLVGATGTHALSSADFTLAFAWGEPAAGQVSSEPTYTIVSGYFGGGFGNGQPFTVLSSRVGKI